MRITKSSQARQLEKGTVVTLNNGWGEVISDYDNFHRGFEVAQMHVDDDGNLYKTGEEFLMVLTDFIGCEY